MTRPSIIVRPKTPLVPEIIKPSPIDQFTIRVYTPALIFFKTAPGATPEELLDELEQSLAGVLDDMPFLAGNVVVEDEAHDTLQIEISDDAGISLKVREYTDKEMGLVLNFDELQNAWFPSSSLNPALLCPRHFIPDQRSPVLDLQANFIQGGLILVLYIHHSVMDGSAIAILAKVWSEHITALSEGRTLQKKEDTPPAAPMQFIVSQGTGSKHHLTDFPGFKPSRLGREDTPMSTVNGTPKLDIPSTLTPSSELTFAYWYIPKEKLRQLEDKAKPLNPKERSMTWSTVFSAWIWRHYSRARRLEESGVREIAFFTPVDSRSRMDPPLSPDYPFNAIVHSRAELTLRELFSRDQDALYRIASKINASIEWWSSDRITELLGAMDAWPKSIKDVERGMDVTCKRDLEITNTSRLPLYASYWGKNLGTPCALRLPGIYVLDGQVNILPRLADGGLEFITYMSVEALENLKKDGDFKEYAQFRCS